tara:strand:- start:694 stop:3765 length:3072 start_codon:yes stop_codon:yes gene_type:complete
MSQQISLNNRLNGNEKFLELQTINNDHFILNNNSRLSLNDNITLSGDLNMNGNLIIGGGLQLGTGSNLTAATLTASTKLTTPIIQFSDNLNAGLTFETGDGADYIILKSTDGSEQIQLKKTTFTDGNSMILGTNGSRGILQYSNIKNSTIDNSNSISANTSGSSASCSGNSATATLSAQSTILENARLIGGISFNGSSNIDLPGVNVNQTNALLTWAGSAGRWAAARTTSFLDVDNNTIGSVSLSGAGATTCILQTPFLDQTNSSAHKLYIKNAVSGHSSTSLQHQIRFENEFMSGMNQSENLIQKWVINRNSTSMIIYDITQSNTFQTTEFLYDSAGDAPRFNNLQFNKDSSTGSFLSLHRNPTSQYDTTTTQKQLPNGIKFISSGDYAGSNLAGLQGGIESNYHSEEVGRTKVYSSYVDGTVKEASLLIGKDLLTISNMPSINIDNNLRIDTYNDIITFTGDDYFNFENPVKISFGSVNSNDHRLSVTHPTSIPYNSGNNTLAVKDIIQLKWNKILSNNTPQYQNWTIGGNGMGNMTFSKDYYATAQTSNSGTRTSHNIMTLGETSVRIGRVATQQPQSNATVDGVNILTEGGGLDIAMRILSTSNVAQHTSLKQGSNGYFQILNNTGNNVFTTSNNNGDTYIDTKTLYYKKPFNTAMRVLDTNTTTGNAYNYILAGMPPGQTSENATEALQMWVNGTAYSTYDSQSAVIGNHLGSLYLGNPSNKNYLYGSETWMGSQSLSTSGKYLKFYKSIANNAHFTISTTYVSNATTAGLFNSFNMHLDSASNPQGNGTPGHIYLNWHNQSGGIFIGNGVSVSSDERIKTNIKVIDDNSALDKILKLETVSYNLIEDGPDAPLKIGFIAQQVEKILPDAVCKAQGYTCEIMETFDFTVINVEIAEEIEAHHILIIDTDILLNGQSYRLVYGGYERDFIAIVEDGITSFKTNNKWDFDEPKQIKIIGKTVDDFLRVRHEDIYNLHHSGIQQLYKNNVELKKEVVELRKMVEDLSKTVKLNELSLKTLI